MESYHLIVVVSAGSQTLELSELRYKQISGRYRTRLLSESMIYHGEGKCSSDTFDFASLSAMADEEIRAITCLSGHYNPGEEHIRDHILKIRTEILHTNWHNMQSRTAILGLGAKQDGVLRNHIIDSTGCLRDTVVFSILNSEWQMVKKSLEFKMSRKYSNS